MTGASGINIRNKRYERYIGGLQYAVERAASSAGAASVYRYGWPEELIPTIRVSSSETRWRYWAVSRLPEHRVWMTAIRCSRNTSRPIRSRRAWRRIYMKRFCRYRKPIRLTIPVVCRVGPVSLCCSNRMCVCRPNHRRVGRVRIAIGNGDGLGMIGATIG